MAETSNVLLISGKILTQDIYLKRHQQSIKRNKKKKGEFSYNFPETRGNFGRESNFRRVCGKAKDVF